MRILIKLGILIVNSAKLPLPSEAAFPSLGDRVSLCWKNQLPGRKLLIFRRIRPTDCHGSRTELNLTLKAPGGKLYIVSCDESQNDVRVLVFQFISMLPKGESWVK